MNRNYVYFNLINKWAIFLNKLQTKNNESLCIGTYSWFNFSLIVIIILALSLSLINFKIIIKKNIVRKILVL